MDKLKKLDPFEKNLRSKIGFPLLDWSSIVSGQQRPNNPPPNSSSSSITVVPKATIVPIIMARNVPPPPAAPARYAPLALPVVLNSFPSKYFARIKTWVIDEEITTEEHVDLFNEFIDREEVDHEDVKLRLFSQSFICEVRKWFKSLTPGSIHF